MTPNNPEMPFQPPSPEEIRKMEGRDDPGFIEANKRGLLSSADEILQDIERLAERVLPNTLRGVGKDDQKPPEVKTQTEMIKDLFNRISQRQDRYHAEIAKLRKYKKDHQLEIPMELKKELGTVLAEMELLFQNAPKDVNKLEINIQWLRDVLANVQEVERIIQEMWDSLRE